MADKVLCARTGCRKKFVPKTGRKYCSYTCQNRDAQRRWRERVQDALRVMRETANG